MRSDSQRGQSLIELVVGIGIGVLFITAAVGIITVSLRIDFQNKFAQTAAELNQQLIEQVATYANADWHNLDTRPLGTALRLATTTQGFIVGNVGSSTKVLDGNTYDTSFSLEAVCRNALDAFIECPASPADPSTFKVTVATQWHQGDTLPELRLVHYLTRIRDRVWHQNDWSNGSTTWSGSPLSEATMDQGWFHNATNTEWTVANEITIFDKGQNLQNTASNGIDATDRYAWNDLFGWADFRITNTVTVGSTLTGYALSNNIGQLALDCATTPGGNVCTTSNFKVSKDSNGILSGYGWNDGIGWISFNCSNGSACATTAPCPTTNPTCVGSGPDYNVRVDAQGNFFGWAWNDVIGWISFNCDHSQDSVPGTNYCTTGGNGASSDYKVKTGSSQVSWAELESIPFDTQRSGGAGFNTIMWQGSMPSDTRVLFQIATSDNSTGPWTYIGPNGTSGNDYYQIAPNLPLRINRADHNNKRYMAYRVILESDPAQSSGPTINNVILNWSH
jgi:type II secretory pathway pseudopilin PulG